MTAKPVTRARVLRRVNRYRHLLTLPPLTVQTAILWPDTLGLCCADMTGAATILINDQWAATDEVLDATVLHELAHAEDLALRGAMSHGPHWRSICRRLTAATGIKVT